MTQTTYHGRTEHSGDEFAQSANHDESAAGSEARGWAHLITTAKPLRDILGQRGVALWRVVQDPLRPRERVLLGGRVKEPAAARVMQPAVVRW